MRVVNSPAADADLEEIATYIAQDNPTRARSYVLELRTKSRQLGDTPGMGRTRPDIGAGIRVLSHGNYLIFYTVHDDLVRIERFMHGARDIGVDDFSGA